MKLHNLNRPRGQNSFCGPAVLSFCTGYSTNDCATVIRSATGRRAVTGATFAEMQHAFEQFGLRLESRHYYRTRATMPTLVQQLRVMRDAGVLTEGRVYLICAGRHYQLVTGRRYACGRVGDIVSIRDDRVKRRARVERVWEVKGDVTEEPVAIQQARTKAVRARKVAKESLGDRAWCMAAERRGVVSLDRDDCLPGEVWVYPGELFKRADPEDEDCIDDPHDGDHLACDWSDARRRVEDYERAAIERGFTAITEEKAA